MNNRREDSKLSFNLKYYVSLANIWYMKFSWLKFCVTLCREFSFEKKKKKRRFTSWIFLQFKRSSMGACAHLKCETRISCSSLQRGTVRNFYSLPFLLRPFKFHRASRKMWKSLENRHDFRSFGSLIAVYGNGDGAEL